jgi:hypothetical protein
MPYSKFSLFENDLPVLELNQDEAIPFDIEWLIPLINSKNSGESWTKCINKLILPELKQLYPDKNLCGSIITALMKVDEKFIQELHRLKETEKST